MVDRPNEPDAPPPDQAVITETLYAQMREVASALFTSERRGHTLQPTAVVNEACMRILSSGLPVAPREQRIALASRVLRQVLIDYARAHDAAKRGGGAVRVSLDPDTLADHPTVVDIEAIHGAVERLRSLSERQAEVVTLRMFGGLTMAQIATTLGMSMRTAEGEWTVARAWLRRELAQQIGRAP